MPLKKVRKIIRYPKMMLWAFFLESVETKQMVVTFVKQGKGKLLTSTTNHKPTEEELQKAMQQLKDIPRFLPFFVFVAVPVPGMTETYVILAVTLEKWLGKKISLLPSNFRNIFQKQTPQS
jgi:hypothetical protein